MTNKTNHISKSDFELMKSYITSFVPCNDDVVRDTAMRIFEGLYVGEDKPNTFEDLVAYYGEDAKHKIYEYVHNEDFSYWYDIEDVKNYLQGDVDYINELFDEHDVKEIMREHYNVSEIYRDSDIEEYVRNNLDITDVYDNEDLMEYLNDDEMIEHITYNYGIDDVFREDDIIDYVQENYGWEDVYSQDEVWDDLISKWDYDDSDLIERVVNRHSPSIFEDSEIINYVQSNIELKDLLDEWDCEDLKESIKRYLPTLFSKKELLDLIVNLDNKEEETNE